MKTGKTMARSVGVRVKRHRDRLERGGKSRLEIVVPTSDAQLLRTVARHLRADADTANAIRTALSSVLDSERAQSGKDLLAFFRASPLVGVDLHILRDKNPGRGPAL